MHRFATYIFGLLLLLLAGGATPVLAMEACCCEPAMTDSASADGCCCEVAPAGWLSQGSSPATCSVSCARPPVEWDLLLLSPSPFTLRPTVLCSVLPAPPKVRPQPPRVVASRALQRRAVPPEPPIAARNINLPPPSAQL